jgi:hypothetical protein
MNYIEQFNAFTVKSAGILSPGATALYVRLFQLNNQHHWAEYFPASLSLLQAMTRTGSINTIRSWQEELESHGFIECRRGGHKKPNLYKLPKLYVSISDTYTDIKGDTYTDTKTDTKTDSIKNKKVNVNKKKSTTYSKKKFTPPTLEEVRAYIQEKNLHVDADYFFQYYSEGDWKDKAGNEVKSWKQKLITWNRRDGGGSQQQKPASTIVDTDIDWSKYDG